MHFHYQQTKYLKWFYFQIIFSITSWKKWASFIFLHILSNIVVKCNVGPLTQNQEECFAPLGEKRIKNKNKCLKCKSALLPGHSTSYLLNFFINFWVYYFFNVFEISGSLVQSKIMFFDALNIPKYHGNDPWWNWGTLFFHEKFDFSGRNDT